MSVPDTIKSGKKENQKKKKSSEGLVALPGTENYDEIVNSYFLELERELKPTCFVTPSSASEVANMLKATNPLDFFLKSYKIASIG